MRADMFKVIVERPRRGSRVRWSTGDRRFFNSEDAPFKLGIRRGRGRSKWLNENLAPLRRFLVRRAGRPWNAVFSEICAVIDTRSTVKQHVRDHVEDLVAVNTRLVDGKIYETGGYSAVYVPLAEAQQELYVDPETGVLMRNFERVTYRQKQQAAAKRRLAELQARRRILSPTEQLHRLDGSWYLVTLSDIPARPGETRWDYLRKKPVSAKDLCAGADLYGRRGVYAAAKRQLGAGELRRYGLR